jgi:hypothetical protein
MPEPLCVYTAISGSIDDHLAPIRVPDDAFGRPVQYICFSDRPQASVAGWTVVPLQFKADTPRLTARWHKIMSHLLFPRSDFTLWHDGSHRLVVNPWTVVDHALSRGEAFATFRHPMRDCAYEEAKVRIRLGKDSKTKLTRQTERYVREGFPTQMGLLETCCIVRDRSSRVQRLNEAWFAEVSNESWRDQVSLPYVIWKLPFNGLGILPGSRVDSPFLDYRPHKIWNRSKKRHTLGAAAPHTS